MIMKKLMVLITAMVMTASMTMAQHKNATAKNGYDYSTNWNKKTSINRGGRGAMMNINSFQKQARENIAYGIINGTITSNEAKHLLEFAERIEIKENKFMRNGRLTGQEVNELKENLNVLNRMIEKDIRDGERSRADVDKHRKRPVYRN
jgi:hypothetical protein